MARGLAVRESAVTFGPSGRLVGILARPEGTETRGEGSAGPALVILNSGIIHRVGPNRLHVHLARRLARAGIPTLRIDQSGIGDSRPLGTTGTPDEEAVLSVRAAMDYLEEIGVGSRFVLFGLCSGAYYALRTARRDPRVVGGVVVDLPGLPSSWRHYLDRGLGVVKRPVVWARFLMGHYRVLRGLLGWLVGAADRDLDALHFSHAELASVLGALTEQETRLLFVVTGSLSPVYSYRDQIFDLVPDPATRHILRPVLYAGVDHTFPAESDRLRLEDEVLEWYRSTDFREETPAPAEAGT